MANLILKVSEEKYRETIFQLEEKISKLKDCLDRLQTQREKLAANYTGPQAEVAIDTVKKNEENVREAIERVNNHKNQLQAYLDSMSQTDSKIKGRYDEAMTAAENVFS